MTVFHDKAPTVPSLSAPIQMYQRKHPVLPPHVVVASSAVAEKEARTRTVLCTAIQSQSGGGQDNNRDFISKERIYYCV